MGSLAKTFGTRVRALRRARDMTQEELGRATGLGYKYIGNLERGERTPSFTAIESVAKAFKIQPYELFLPEDVPENRFNAEHPLSGQLNEVDRDRLERFFHEVLTAIYRVRT